MEIWKEGTFLLDEGTQLEGDLDAARLTGLTIASAAVSATEFFNGRINSDLTPIRL